MGCRAGYRREIWWKQGIDPGQVRQATVKVPESQWFVYLATLGLFPIVAAGWLGSGSGIIVVRRPSGQVGSFRED